MTEITYGILHYNPHSHVEATQAYINAVQSLAVQRSSRFTSEVYLIDQDSQPLLTSKLANLYGFQPILLNKNVGISRGINLLARLARGQFISLVTSDVIFTPRLDEDLISILESNDNILQIAPASDKSSLLHQKFNSNNHELVFNLAQELTIQFWPRRVFDTIGYFDERWKACYENLDFALRIFLSGGLVALCPDMLCPHEHNMSTKTGAIHDAYRNYIDMPNGLDHSPLLKMWKNKWPQVDRLLDIYATLPSDVCALRARLNSVEQYRNNIYLPYIQNVGY